ncbi:MAG TPA: hypothetical protein ENK24_00730 [Anaerolineae bacterium]|nr:hypothetical protein [Anaerolineae bacterium]
MAPGVLPPTRNAPVGGNGDSTVIRELDIQAMIAAYPYERKRFDLQFQIDDLRLGEKNRKSKIVNQKSV